GVATTPLQIMHAVTGIGNGGKYYTPHVFKEAKATEESAAISYQPKLREAGFSQETAKILSEGMWRVVNGSGTGRRAAIAGFDVCGKTGTAQVVGIQSGATGDQKEHAWFVGYAPKESPEIGGVALVEHAGHGGTESAPIIKACFEEYLRKKKGLPKEELAQGVTNKQPNTSIANTATNNTLSSMAVSAQKTKPVSTAAKPSLSNQTSKPTTDKPTKPNTTKPIVKPAALLQPNNITVKSKPQIVPTQVSLEGGR
ncbi:MAG: penicillin-binding protein 2, partial [bacterium]